MPNLDLFLSSLTNFGFCQHGAQSFLKSAMFEQVLDELL